jgi:hypothetical protein
VLATLVLASLPFLWSEDMSCKGEALPPVTGIRILFGKDFDSPAPGLIFLGLLLLTVGLGFLASWTARPWRRLAGEIAGGLTALGTSFLCLLMMTHGGPQQPLHYPAAWIGTLAALGMAFEAWWGSGDALRRGIEERRPRLSRARIAAGAGVRVAAPGDAPEEEVEEEGVEPVASRRRELPRPG